MQQSILNEAAGALRTLIDAVMAVPIDRTTVVAGSLNQAAGSLRAGAETAIDGLSFGGALADLFRLLRQAGASFAAVDAVRVQGLQTATRSGVAGVVVDTVVLQALACQCRIVADMTFSSRGQVDSVRAALDAGFESSLTKASNDFDQVTVRALVSLRAAVMRDLTVRARPLPKMISYTFPQRRPALAIAQRLYADGDRYLEVIQENAAVHPLFMPASGRALSR